MIFNWVQKKQTFCSQKAAHLNLNCLTNYCGLEGKIFSLGQQQRESTSDKSNWQEATAGQQLCQQEVSVMCPT